MRLTSDIGTLGSIIEATSSLILAAIFISPSYRHAKQMQPNMIVASVMSNVQLTVSIVMSPYLMIAMVATAPMRRDAPIW